MAGGRLSRRGLLLGGAGAVVLAVGGGYELVEHGELPGKTRLDRFLGRENVKQPDATFGPTGPAVSGSFYSQARRRTVEWTISYRPGHRPGDQLPLVLALHGFDGNHTYPIGPRTPAQLLGARLGKERRPLPPMAVAAVDGGNGYWHAHPGDDPMRMLLSEFLPMCRQRGLGTGPHYKIGLTGESMGGYGDLLLAEQHPGLVAAVAAISPAVWTTYADSQNANPDAFTSMADFAAHDVIAHADALRGIPVRIASGRDDPFHPFLESLVPRLPAGAEVHFPPGVHDGEFFGSQAVPSLAFLGKYLAG